MYDFAHPLSDAIEGITHSLCTLEFEDHRPLYNWFLEALGDPRAAPADRVRPAGADPHGDEQAEAAPAGGRGLRQRLGRSRACRRSPACAGGGTRPKRSASSATRIGVSKTNSVIDFALLEHCRARRPQPTAPRVMAVLDPLKVVITNYPEGQTE